MSYIYRFNRINSDYNIDLFKTFRVLSNEFTTEEDIYRLIRFFPTVSIKNLDTIYSLLEENKSVRIFIIPIIHPDNQLGYNKAHFLIQQDIEEDGKYIFIGDIDYHIDEEIYSVIEECFSSLHMRYYSTEQLLLMIDNQYIGLFCDIFDLDNYYNESFFPYFENQNMNYNFIQNEDDENELIEINDDENELIEINDDENDIREINDDET